MDSQKPAIDPEKALGFIELWTQGVSRQTIASFLGDEAAPVDEIADLLALPPRTKKSKKKAAPAPAPEPESPEDRQARELQTLLRTEGKYAALADWAAAQTPPLTLTQASQRWHLARAAMK